MTLEITEEKVTKGNVINVLPWLPGYFDKHLNGKSYQDLKDPDVAAALAAGSFTFRSK
jgi:uncharacterized protein YbgA (DUF1722 family)